MKSGNNDIRVISVQYCSIRLCRASFIRISERRNWTWTSRHWSDHLFLFLDGLSLVADKLRFVWTGNLSIVVFDELEIRRTLSMNPLFLWFSLSGSQFNLYLRVDLFQSQELRWDSEQWIWHDELSVMQLRDQSQLAQTTHDGLAIYSQNACRGKRGTNLFLIWVRLWFFFSSICFICCEWSRRAWFAQTSIFLGSRTSVRKKLLWRKWLNLLLISRWERNLLFIIVGIWGLLFLDEIFHLSSWFVRKFLKFFKSF